MTNKIDTAICSHGSMGALIMHAEKLIMRYYNTDIIARYNIITSLSLSLLLIKAQTWLENKISAVYPRSSNNPDWSVLPTPRLIYTPPHPHPLRLSHPVTSASLGCRTSSASRLAHPPDHAATPSRSRKPRCRTSSATPRRLGRQTRPDCQTTPATLTTPGCRMLSATASLQTRKPHPA
jgi:hypothetical protein